ncbi:MAG: trypsin-like serine protease [Actinomycetota bacterium]
MRFPGKALALLGVAAMVLLSVGQAGAITFGVPDGNDHPNVGALIAEWRTPGVKEEFCSGTLVAPSIFLTASHCTAGLESREVSDVWVSFDTDIGDPVRPTTNLIHGAMHTNPVFGFSGPGGFSDPHDIAVIVLDQPAAAIYPGIEPAALPALGLFDRLSAKNGLRGQKFTAVGYGTHQPQPGTGPLPDTFPFDGKRWRAVSEFNAINAAWLRLSQNRATGDGGTCFGDSGGPNFLGAGATETDVIAAVTVTGDAVCRATNVIYRLDTASARQFLGSFGVPLP